MFSAVCCCALLVPSTSPHWTIAASPEEGARGNGRLSAHTHTHTHTHTLTDTHRNQNGKSMSLTLAVSSRQSLSISSCITLNLAFRNRASASEETGGTSQNMPPQGLLVPPIHCGNKWPPAHFRLQGLPGPMSSAASGRKSFPW